MLNCVYRQNSAPSPSVDPVGTDFLVQWEREKGVIDEKLDELEALREFYEGFLAAYDGLIVEIGRRRNVHIRTQKILQEALIKIDKLYQGMCLILDVHP